jgi:hypothetical protein
MSIYQRLLFGIFITTCLPISLTAQTVGPNSPGTGTNINVTGNTWSNPGFVTSSDNSYASVTLSFLASSDALIATNFGFSIPLTATIDGITVSIEKNGTGYMSDAYIQLTKDGTTAAGNNHAQLFTAWPGTDTSVGYGNATDLWGTTWTPAEINSNNFGVYARVWGLNPFGSSTANVDHITVTIDYSIPTPVELISFDGNVINEAIELKWKTTLEVNNDFFTVERSVNGLNYLKIGDVDGSGSSNILSEYSFIDPLPFKGNNYYRLSQSDFDGTTEVFKPIMVRYDGESPVMKIYPNPVYNDLVNLIVNQDFLKGEENRSYILVRNITGELIYQKSISEYTPGERILLNQKFKSGIYILELQSSYGSSKEKLIVK